VQDGSYKEAIESQTTDNCPWIEHVEPAPQPSNHINASKDSTRTYRQQKPVKNRGIPGQG
jgi:hypothetical protein